VPKNSGVHKALKGLVDSKQILPYKPELGPNKPIFYHLKKHRAWNKHNWEHEHACAQIYVSYACTGKVRTWKAHEDLGGVKPDRLMMLDEGVMVLWEVDRGTEVLDTDQDKPNIKGKIKNYLRLRSEYPGKRFYICFVTMDYGLDPFTGAVKQTAKSRAKAILDLYYYDFGFKGNQFLVTTLDQALTDPLGRILYSAKRPEGVSFGELLEGERSGFRPQE
jgi:hypothetical protein